MTASNGARSIEDIMLLIVRSYPPSLRRRVDIAAVTRVFSRDLLLTLIATHATTTDDRDALWHELIALPIVERRPNEMFALHETTRLPLLAELKRREPEFVSAVASSALDYFLPRANSNDGQWSDMLEAVYYYLLEESETAIEDVDQFLLGPVVSGYPARRSAVIAVALELVEAGLLKHEAPRWTRIWQLEELVDNSQSEKAIQIAKSELGADARDFVIRDYMDGRIANVLGLAHAQLGNTEAALALYEQVIASGADVVTALAGVGDVYVARNQWAQAEGAFFAALEHLVRAQMVDIGDSPARGSLRIRQATAWQMPFDLTIVTDDVGQTVVDNGGADTKAESITQRLIFLEGDKGTSDDSVDLIELDDGRCGVLIEPGTGLGELWARLANVYLSTSRLDEAHSAAFTGGAIAELLGDNDGMSRVFDVLAGIGMQRGDPDFLRMAESANREVLEAASQTGDPPSRMRAWLRLGWSDVSAGHPGAAAAAFRDAQRIASDIDDRVALASALLGAAEVARQEDRTADASAALLAAIAEYEMLGDVASIASTRHDLGIHYIAAGQPKLASDALEAARLLFVQLGDLAGQASVRVSMASAASMVGDYATADNQIDLGRSLARQHGDPRVAVSVELKAGALLEERYESAAAADVYRGALALATGPLYADLRALCHMNIGDAESGRNDGAAVAEYSEAASAYRKIGDTVNELHARAAHVVALSKVGDESAIDLADEILASLSPDFGQDLRSKAYLTRASALTELGRYGEALEALSGPAIADMGTEPIVQRLELLSLIGRFADVVADIDPIIERAPYRAYLYSLKGWSLLNLDPPAAEAALAACDTASRLKPDDPWYQKDVATCLLILGQPERARALVDGVIARLSRPDLEILPIDTMQLLGFCLFQAGDYGRAQEHLAAAIERDPEDVASDLDLALVEMCAGADGAEDHYARIVDKLAAMNPERRRGILVVALRDVENALRWGRIGNPTVAARVADRIRSALSAIP